MPLWPGCAASCGASARPRRVARASSAVNALEDVSCCSGSEQPASSALPTSSATERRRAESLPMLGVLTGRLQCLADVGKNVVDVLDADGQPHHVPAHACLEQLLVVQLTMGSGGRVAGQGAGIADVDQPQDHLQGVDEPAACFLTAADAEAQDARSAALHVLLRQRMIGAVGQAGVVHPFHLLMPVQEFGYLLG